MTPRSNPSEFPIIVSGRVRPWFDHRNLDLVMRLSIRARKATKGIAFTPVHPTDERAIAWIKKTAARYGVMRWTRQGWVKEKYVLDHRVG